MTRDQEIAETRKLLAYLQGWRKGTAECIADNSRDKHEMLDGFDNLIARARAHLARLGDPDAHVPPIAAAPEALQ